MNIGFLEICWGKVRLSGCLGFRYNMITNRSLDVCYEILSELDVSDTMVYLRSGGIDTSYLSSYSSNTVSSYKSELRNAIDEIEEGCREDFINSIIQRNRTIRNSIIPKYRFDERWSILVNSLMLDGYNIADNQLAEQDPIISGTIRSEDNLYTLIRESEINDVEEIIRLLESSRKHYEIPPIDYNACLIDIRTPLETIVKNVANKVAINTGENRELSSWGNSISYLRSKGIITVKDEAILTSTYSLLSELHRPIYISEKEMTRYARSLGLNAIWYIIHIFKYYIGGNTYKGNDDE